MSVVDRVDKGELVLCENVGKYKFHTCEDETNELYVPRKLETSKLLSLARIGEKMQQEVENCNRNVLSCYVKKCPGRNYCRTYHEPKVKRQIILPEPPD